MGDPILNSPLVTLVCGVFVAGYALQRFNTPKTNRISTTRLLFGLSGAGYVFASLTLYLILCEIVLKPGVLPFLGLEDAQKIVAQFSAPPVLAAAILTSLLPNLMGLSTFDHWLLQIFQSWGQIPHGVTDLADKMPQNILLISELQRRELCDWIVDEPDNPGELAERLKADAEKRSRDRCTHVLWVYKTLQDWHDVPAYAPAFRSRDKKWENLKETHQVFTVESQAFFLLFESLAKLGEAGETELKISRDRYGDICETRYRKLVEFLAQMLLIVEPNELQIERKLQRIGFVLQESIHPPTLVGPFVFIGAIASFLMLVIVPLVPLPHSGPVPLTVILLVIGTTKTIGLIVAVYPKLAWSFFRPNDKGNLPFAAWLGSAAFAGMVSFMFERLVLIIATHDSSAGFDFIHHPITPVAPAASALCLAIAIMCDVDLHLGHGWMRRMTEALLCGVAVLLSIVICINLLDIRSATGGLVTQWFPFVLSFSLGFGFGLFGPYLYRIERGLEERSETAVVRTA